LSDSSIVPAADEPRLSGYAARRSRVVSHPLRAVNRNTRAGRYINDLTARWLELLGHPTDPETLRNVVAAAQLAWRCDCARGDVDVHIDSVTRLENLLARRLKALGIIKPRGKKLLTRIV